MNNWNTLSWILLFLSLYLISSTVHLFSKEVLEQEIYKYLQFCETLQAGMEESFAK